MVTAVAKAFNGGITAFELTSIIPKNFVDNKHHYTIMHLSCVYYCAFRTVNTDNFVQFYEACCVDIFKLHDIIIPLTVLTNAVIS